uniref:Patchoulol synthase n=1 Tax=Pogostemon cablin TaxID=28511 RepID=A0A385SVZ7_POGCB|nr:patchoulol synthase [Pogostemon cablin]
MELYAQSVGVGAASRPLANFHQCVWGDKFIVYNPQSSQAGEREQAEELKVELKRELKEASDNYMRQLKMVDAIQRLGIDYLFVEDVDEALKNLFEMFDAFCKSNHDMHATALSFRLLRQHGYRVSCEVFEKFKDGKDGFKVPNEDGAVAVLEFFEATHLRVHGEDVLDNAFVFTRNYLESVYATLNDPTANQVHNALNEFSFRRGLPRVEARKYISIYEQYASHHKGLLKLAKLDFNLVQALHRRELSEDSRWWKTLQVPTELSFVRDRLVESYFWASGSYFEPNYSVARMILAKGLAVLSLMDDVYDAYGTFEELQVFTDAIERWDASCLDKLPEYMKIVYKALLDVFEEVDEEVIKLGAPYRVYYGKEAMKYAARAYMEEAQWREQKHKPTTKEYMKLATKTCGYITLIILSFLGVEEGIVTKEAFDWVFSRPPFVEATLIIARLINDITGCEFGNKREHVRTAVECYMEEHKVGKQEVVSEFYNQMESAWKDINECLLRPAEFPIPLLNLILNSVRTLEVIYKEGDSYTHVGPAMQNIIKQLYLHPVPY